MEVSLNVGNILTMVLAALIGVVWQTLQGSIARIERNANEDRKASDDRLTRLEAMQLQLPQQLEKISRDVAAGISSLELKLAQHHPTRDELSAAVSGRHEKFVGLEQKVGQLSTEVTRLVSIFENEHPRSAVRRRG